YATRTLEGIGRRQLRPDAERRSALLVSEQSNCTRCLEGDQQRRAVLARALDRGCRAKCWRDGHAYRCWDRLLLGSSLDVGAAERGTNGRRGRREARRVSTSQPRAL